MNSQFSAWSLNFGTPTDQSFGLLLGIFRTEQESSAALEQIGDIVDVWPGQVAHAHLQYVQNRVRLSYLELSQLGVEPNVLF